MPQPGPADSTIAAVKEQMVIEWFQIDKTVACVALVIGIFIIIVAYFAGGKENKSKILFSIICSVVIAILTMPLFIKFGRWTGIVGYRWGVILLVSVFIIFIAAVGVHAYEIITVSAKEARPD